jgi:mRNA interferase RelE/StbE
VGGRSRVGSPGPDYELRLHRAASRSFKRLHGGLRERITAAIDELASDPRPAGAEKLVGRDDYRIRVGDYRFVYAVDDHARFVTIARIAHRREVYRR